MKFCKIGFGTGASGEKRSNFVIPAGWAMNRENRDRPPGSRLKIVAKRDSGFFPPSTWFNLDPGGRMPGMEQLCNPPG